MTSRTYTTPVWDPSVSVRGSECQYIPDSNSLYLPAALFNKEETYEEMLGTDGFLIANSIAHSIFGTGAYYNEFGEYKHWWSEDDQSEYLARMSPLTEKLNNITYMENAKYNGVLVREEAAIDLASMQTLHKIAENKGKFDYKTFYESFTKMLKMEKSVKEIRAWALDNEVPLPYIRVNLTLSQFDEFAETYRVHPNDRMHVDEAAKLFILE